MRHFSSVSFWVVLMALGFAGATTSVFAQDAGTDVTVDTSGETPGSDEPVTPVEGAEGGLPADEASASAPTEVQNPDDVVPTFDNDLSDLVPVEDTQPATTTNPDGTVSTTAQSPANAQQPLGSLTPDQLVSQILTEELNTIYSDDVVVLPDFPSLLFLPGEHSSLEAAKATFVARPVTPDEVEDSLKDGLDGEDGTGGPQLVPAIREISLGGIMYNAPDDWIIWLNKEKITPEALPEEVMGVDVHKDYVELRWFDKQTNKIFPVRLRPNQRFNLDALLFLPG
ncbi:MAG: hypothetical protein AB7E85_09530 [Pseudobdellovibrionaceae bacterium]